MESHLDLNSSEEDLKYVPISLWVSRTNGVGLLLSAVPICSVWESSKPFLIGSPILIHSRDPEFQLQLLLQ